MSIANTEQAEHWNTGPGVAHWVANQARYDRMHAPFTALILQAAALRPGGNVLDVGCGCGGTTLAAARLVAPGQALGLDLSGPMLARARSDAEAAGLANVTFRQGDAQVESLEPAGFEVVISRFGVMFFADRRRLRQHQSAVWAPAGFGWSSPRCSRWPPTSGCWSPAAPAEHLPPPLPSADGPGMFAFADPERLRPTLAAAGWRDVEITSEHASIPVGGAEASTTRSSSCAPRRRAGPCLAGADAATAEARSRSVRAALSFLVCRRRRRAPEDAAVAIRPGL
jgi:SAM-dependent methyltransferase